MRIDYRVLYYPRIYMTVPIDQWSEENYPKLVRDIECHIKQLATTNPDEVYTLRRMIMTSIRQHTSNDFDIGYRYGVRNAEGKILEQSKRIKELENTLRDFLTTKEDRSTWVEEMQGTIEAVLEEGE